MVQLNNLDGVGISIKAIFSLENFPDISSPDLNDIFEVFFELGAVFINHLKRFFICF